MEQTKEIVDLLKALGDLTRHRIFCALVSCKGHLCVNAIAKKVKVSQPAVSQHLKVLKNAGLVTAERQGYHIHYTVDRKRLRILSDYIAAFHDPEASSAACNSTDCHPEQE